MARSVAAPQRRLTACLVRACRPRTQRSPFAVAYCLTARENPSSHKGVAEMRKVKHFTCGKSDGLSGILQTLGFFLTHADFGAWP